MSAAEFVPPDHTLERLQEAAAGCRGCPLWQRATQTVFGAGAAPARLMLVGEQPGDKEDVAGEPFVGPAGHVLDEALADAAIERDSVYVTNAVKHFKWIPGRGGKQRLHQKPGRLEIVACRPWLDAELDAVKPAVIVALGATAAQALLGPAFRLTKQRGELVPQLVGPPVIATFHPSAVLRAPDDAARDTYYKALVDDLGVARGFGGSTS